RQQIKAPGGIDMGSHSHEVDEHRTPTPAGADKHDPYAEFRLPASRTDAVVKQSNLNKLVDEHATPQEKLKAAEYLWEHGKKVDGKVTVTVQDKDGPRNIELEVESAGKGRKMVHVFADDKEGNSHTVLRGIDKGNGQFVKETMGNREVGFN